MQTVTDALALLLTRCCPLPETLKVEAMAVLIAGRDLSHRRVHPTERSDGV